MFATTHLFVAVTEVVDDVIVKGGAGDDGLAGGRVEHPPLG